MSKILMDKNFLPKGTVQVSTVGKFVPKFSNPLGKVVKIIFIDKNEL